MKIVLEPDAVSMLHARYVLLKACPFCGANAFPPVEELNPDTGVYLSWIHCSNDTRCGCSVLYSALSRQDARRGAEMRWNDRRPRNERRPDVRYDALFARDRARRNGETVPDVPEPHLAEDSEV